MNRTEFVGHSHIGVRRRGNGPHTSDRFGPECGEASRASISATVRRAFPAAISTERSSQPSADRKRSCSIPRVAQRVGGASGEPDHLSRCPAECWAIRFLSQVFHEMTIPHRRTAEDGVAMRTDLDLAMAAAVPHVAVWDRSACGADCVRPRAGRRRRGPGDGPGTRQPHQPVANGLRASIPRSLPCISTVGTLGPGIPVWSPPRDRFACVRYHVVANSIGSDNRG